MTVAGIVVIGSVNADLVIQVDRRPSPGETVLGGDLRTVPGGKGANQAVAASRLGADVALVGCVGDDSHGSLLRQSMVAAGVDLSRLRSVNAPTGVALITVTPDGDNSIIVSPGANAQVSTGDADDAAKILSAGTVLLLQLEVPQPVVEHAARLAGRVGARVVLNLAPPHRLSPDVLTRCDPLVVNEHEAAYLLADGPRPAAVDPGIGGRELVRQLLDLGPRSVVVTLGAQGAIVGAGETYRHLPSPQVDAVDTTGAGDAFIGALATRLAGGASLVDAAEFAVRVAAASVQRPGAQSSFPNLEEIQRL